MDKSIYFLILDIGITREKGAQSFGLWKIGEKKRLNAEIKFWKNLIRNVREENDGTDCSDKVYAQLKALAERYRLPNYRLILSRWGELQNCHFETDTETERKVCFILDDLLNKALCEKRKGRKYEILRRLHNIPRCMHGASCIQPGCKAISLSDALEYAGLSAYFDGEY